MLNLNDSGLYHPINCKGSVVGYKADDEDDQIDQEETDSLLLSQGLRLAALAELLKDPD